MIKLIKKNRFQNVETITKIFLTKKNNFQVSRRPHKAIAIETLIEICLMS